MSDTVSAILKRRGAVTDTRKSAVAIAAALVLAGALNTRVESSPAQPVPARAYSGTITLISDSFPDATPLSWNCCGNIQADNTIAGTLVASPIGINDHGRYFADLAAVVPTTANGALKVVHGNEVMTLHLKPNLKWSDGSPITANDYIADMVLTDGNAANGQAKTVAFSGNDMIITYKGIYGPAVYNGIPMPIPIEFLQKSYGIHIPAALTASYNASKLAAILNGHGYKGSALQKLIDRWLADPYDAPGDIFSGPYKIQTWVDQQQIVEVPNPYYSALPPDPNHPRLARIRFMNTFAVYAQAMTLQSTYDQIDLATHFTTPDLTVLRQSKFKISFSPNQSFSVLELNEGVPALADVRVRQALNYAIDKTTFIRELYAGVSLDDASVRLLSLATPITQSSPYFDSRIPSNPYNPARARSLLAAAGYATSPGPGKHLVLALSISPYVPVVHTAQLLQRFWAQVGITVRLRPLPNVNSVYSRRDFQILFYLGFISDLDPDSFSFFVDPGQIPNAAHPDGVNASGINDPLLFRLLLKARHTVDEGQRHRYWDQFQERFAQQAYWIIPYVNPNIAVYKPALGNFKPSPFPSGVSWNAFQWYRSGS
jgi:peptide/nickel transport system substrate-binding protein